MPPLSPLNTPFFLNAYLTPPRSCDRYPPTFGIDGQKILLYLNFVLIEITFLTLSIIAVKFMGKRFQIASNLNRLISSAPFGAKN